MLRHTLLQSAGLVLILVLKLAQADLDSSTEEGASRKPTLTADLQLVRIVEGVRPSQISVRCTTPRTNALGRFTYTRTDSTIAHQIGLPHTLLHGVYDDDRVRCLVTTTTTTSVQQSFSLQLSLPTRDFEFALNDKSVMTLRFTSVKSESDVRAVVRIRRDDSAHGDDGTKMRKKVDAFTIMCIFLPPTSVGILCLVVLYRTMRSRNPPEAEEDEENSHPPSAPVKPLHIPQFRDGTLIVEPDGSWSVAVTEDAYAFASEFERNAMDLPRASADDATRFLRNAREY